jgi:hypothetical protein
VGLRTRPARGGAGRVRDAGDEGRPAPQVLEQDGARGIREWQDQGDPAFALVDLQPAAAPIDRVQREGDDLARAQAVGGDEEEHRVVAEAVRGATIHRA